MALPRDSSINTSTREFSGSGFAVIAMGVSGSGKTTIGSMLAETLGCEFLDADNYHTRINIEKMQNGEALDDEDRIPWLEKLRDILNSFLLKGETVVLACSALRSRYREILRDSVPTEEQQLSSRRLVFVHLKPSEFLVSRVEARFRGGEHYMPPSLLKSQIACLEMRAGGEDDILEVETGTEPGSILEDVLSKLAQHLSSYQQCPETKSKPARKLK